MAATVLIVEDDPTTIDLVRLYLRRDGYRVLTASDGLEGLNVARESRPDLVVLDLMLPKVDGLTVCQELREESNVPSSCSRRWWTRKTGCGGSTSARMTI